MLFFPPKHSRVYISLHLCTSTSALQPQILHCTQKLLAITHSTLPEFLRVFITLLEAETTSLLNACLLLLQMAGKSCREVGAESPSCNVKSSGDYSGNKLFTLKTHKPLSIHLKATKMCGITPRPQTRSDLSARCFIAVVIATASACTRG